MNNDKFQELLSATKEMTEDEKPMSKITDFVETLYENGKTPSERFGLSHEQLSEMEVLVTNDNTDEGTINKWLTRETDTIPEGCSLHKCTYK